jgi:ABC-type transport system involved in multi-copper enzyme maturation permease subunit
LLALLTSAGNIVIYQYANHLLESGGASSPMFQDITQDPLMKNFTAFVWDRWFATNGPLILALFAVALGSELIAREVSKGTIFFLLSKPVSRERILLTKYAVSMGLLLAVSIIISLVIAIAGIAVGHPQDLLHLLIATGLLWLATLFPLGLSLFFSIVSPDPLRSVVFSTLMLGALVMLPILLPDGLNWSLGYYWSNQSTYLASGFPLKEYLVCLFTALVPLLAALAVFRRKAY